MGCLGKALLVQYFQVVRGMGYLGKSLQAEGIVSVNSYPDQENQANDGFANFSSNFQGYSRNQ